jgi:hypothetical protein
MVAPLQSPTLIVGETYSAKVNFTDPGIESWSANVSYGDLTTEQFPNVGKTFPIAHTYTAACNCTLSVNVADGAKTGMATANITVLTPFKATTGLGQQLQLLPESGLLAPQDVQPLLASLDAAARQIQRGNTIPAVNELGAFINKLTAAAISGRMDTATSQQLSAMAQRIQRSLQI